MSNNPGLPMKLSGWAIVEMTGLNPLRYVGTISEYRLGHAAFVCVEVPEQPSEEGLQAVEDCTIKGLFLPAGTRFRIQGKPAFTKRINTTEVRSIMHLSEEQAMENLERIRPRKIVLIDEPQSSPVEAGEPQA